MIIDSAASGRLAYLGILRFTGADTLSFLQGQLSNDTQRLNEGTPLLAAYSTAQGRVLALIYLLPHSSGVVAILPREILQPTMERMRKFILRAKVRIEDAADALVVAGRFGTIPQRSFRFAEQDGIGTAPVAHDAKSSVDHRSRRKRLRLPRMPPPPNASKMRGGSPTFAPACRRSMRRRARRSSHRC